MRNKLIKNSMLARVKHQNIFGIRTEPIRDSIHKQRLRLIVMKVLKDSMDENETLGWLLAK